jgi:RNA polymerase sigma-70 factor (ECF subfamily)
MGKNPFTEEEIVSLVSQSQEGSSEAFGKLYEHFFDAVYRYCAFHLPSEMAEDTVAEIFVRAWENLHRYKPRHGIPFAAWLFRIARHRVIDVYRARRDIEELSDEIADHDPLNNTEAGLERSETIRTVRQCLMQLPARHREILLLSFMADMPHNEIARTLKMTEGGVRVLKMRALRGLKKLLPPDIAFPT